MSAESVNSDISALIELSSCALSDGHNHEVIKLLEPYANNITEVNQINSTIFGNLSQAHLNLNKNQRAGYFARKALEGEPGNLRWWLKLLKSEFQLTLVEKDNLCKAICDSTSSDILTTTTLAKIKEIMNLPKKSGYQWYQKQNKVVISFPFEEADSNQCSGTIYDDPEHETSRIVLRLVSENAIKESQLILTAPVSAIDFEVHAKRVVFELVKRDPNIYWSELEKDVKKCLNKSQVKDWDKIADELDEQLKKEGIADDDGVDSFFQKIYEQGSPEVRKAMTKSFQESAGTVLSTDWADISKKKTPIQPPEGVEFKKWDE